MIYSLYNCLILAPLLSLGLIVKWALTRLNRMLWRCSLSIWSMANRERRWTCTVRSVCPFLYAFLYIHSMYMYLLFLPAAYVEILSFSWRFTRWQWADWEPIVWCQGDPRGSICLDEGELGWHAQRQYIQKVSNTRMHFTMSYIQ